MAYGSTQMPYNYAKNAGAPLLDNVNPEQVGGGTTPNVAGQANQPPKSAVQPNLGGPQPSAPPQTFAQMQVAGYARPPMPAPTQAPNVAPSGQLPVSAAPANAPPQGFTLGQAGGADWGRSYYNGAPVSGLEPNKDGTYNVYMNDANGIYNGQRQQISGADAAALQAAQQANRLAPGQTPGGQSGAGGATPQQLMALASTGQRAAPGGPSFDVSGNGSTMSLASPSGQTLPGSQGAPYGAGSGSPVGGPVGVGFGNYVQPYGTPDPTPTAAPQGYDILGALTGGAQGGGQGGQLQGATNQAALNQLNNPSPYNSDAVKALYGWLGGDIQDQYTQGQRAIGENMARRGLGTSTIHAGALNDLNVGRRSAQESMGQNLAQNYAQTLGQYQANAIGQGNQVGSQNQQNQQSWLNQLMGYGQQGFNNDLATQGMNEQQQQNYQNYILGLLQYGQGG